MIEKIKGGVDFLRICLVLITVYGIGYASYCVGAIIDLFEEN